MTPRPRGVPPAGGAPEEPPSPVAGDQGFVADHPPVLAVHVPVGHPGHVIGDGDLQADALDAPVMPGW